MSEIVFRYGDDYPAQCPPEKAYHPQNISLYRICKSEISSGTVITDDFIPIWEAPNRKFPRPNGECGAKALSFNNDIETLTALLKDHPNMGNRIIKFKLNESCGLLLKTSKKHYNLWDLISPTNIIEAIGNEWEEVV